MRNKHLAELEEQSHYVESKIILISQPSPQLELHTVKTKEVAQFLP